jgi:hypothetical protein
MMEDSIVTIIVILHNFQWQIQNPCEVNVQFQVDQSQVISLIL